MSIYRDRPPVADDSAEIEALRARLRAHVLFGTEPRDRDATHVTSLASLVVALVAAAILFFSAHR